MEKVFVFVKKIVQLTNSSFQIVWSDEKISEFYLSDLQMRCPCARCQERTLKEKNEKVKAKRIYSLGNYALKIEFTSGCSRGVFTFNLLRQIA